MSYGLPTPDELARRRRGNTQQYAPARPVEPRAYASGPGPYNSSQRAPSRAIQPPTYASGSHAYSQPYRQTAPPQPEFRRSQAPSPMTDRDHFVRARQTTQGRADPTYARAELYAQAQRIQTRNRQVEAQRHTDYVDNGRRVELAAFERGIGELRRDHPGYGEVHRSSAHRIQRQESVAGRWEQESRARQQSFQRPSGQDDVGRSRLAADLAARRRR